MHYCGIVPARGLVQLVIFSELRTPEPPIRLQASFYEPGEPEQVAGEVAALGEVVVAVAGPPDPERAGSRTCDEILRRLGVPPSPPDAAIQRAWATLGGLPRYEGEGEEGIVPDGAFRDAPAIETNTDAVFCALQGRRLPSKRHPLGMQMRIAELEDDHVVDDGGGLWQRRMEEVEAAGAALCAHRYAVGHALHVGGEDGTLVLPGSSLPESFSTQGVLPPVERLQLPPRR